MKKFILSISILMLTTAAFSQNCLRILQPTFFSGPASDGTYTLTINYDTEGNKSLQTTIFCGSSVIFSDCFSDRGPGTKVYSGLVCSGGLPVLSARFITKTGSCNAADCDTTFLGQGGGPLPIKLGAFSAIRSKQTVELNWSTNEEIDSREFVIERGEGNAFRSIGTVRSAGNSSTTKTYTFNDRNDNTGLTYYRLKNVDLNGRFTYSEVRTVKGSSTSFDVTVYPNPARANSKTFVAGATANSSIQLVDFSGKVLKNLPSNTMNFIDLSGVENGTYIIRVMDRSTKEVVNKKLTVTN